LPQALAESHGPPLIVTEAAGLTAGLARLRSEAFDVVLIDDDVSSSAPRDLLQVIQAASHECQPVMVLADPPQPSAACAYADAGAAGYLSLRQHTAGELICQLARAADAGRWRAEHQSLLRWRDRQQELEERESSEWLEDLSRLVDTWRATPVENADLGRGGQRRGADLRANHGVPRAPPFAASAGESLADALRDLMQAYVLMGRGALAAEIKIQGRAHLLLLEILGAASRAHVGYQADDNIYQLRAAG
jgi:hypothetical protein